MQVLLQEFDYSKNKSYNFLFASDLHLDAHDHNRKRMLADFDQGLEAQARFYIGGDTMDMILPTDAKRYVRGSDIQESQAQINEIVNKAVRVLKPYVNNIDAIGMGNHESSVLKYHSVDPVQWLVQELNHIRDPKLLPIFHLGYTGYIVHNYHYSDKNAVRRLKIAHHHGVGGASPVTKGIIDFNRFVNSTDADIYWLGHKHTSPIDPGMERMHLDKNNQPFIKTLKAFYTAGYKGGHIHKQLGTYGYTPDFSTERFLNHSSCGCVHMTTYIAASGIATELKTPRI